MIAPIDLPDRKDPKFPNALKKLRMKFHLTRKELSDLANISRSMPRRYEEVKCAIFLSPKQVTLDKIINVFKQLNKDDDDRVALELDLINRSPVKIPMGPIRTIWQPGYRPKNATY